LVKASAGLLKFSLRWIAEKPLRECLRGRVQAGRAGRVVEQKKVGPAKTNRKAIRAKLSPGGHHSGDCKTGETQRLWPRGFRSGNVPSVFRPGRAFENWASAFSFYRTEAKGAPNVFSEKLSRRRLRTRSSGRGPLPKVHG